MSSIRGSRDAAALAALLSLSLAARADVTFTVAVDDPSSQLQPYTAQLVAHIQAAANDWAAHLDGTANLTIRVRPTGVLALSSAYSHTSALVGFDGQYFVYEQGAASHIRTGVNPAPGNATIEFEINPAYIAAELWFDPDPVARTAPVPFDRTDAMSVCLHELGHALAYNGWMDGFDGSLPGDYRSTFDRHVSFDGTDFVFNGPAAVAVYGGPVPITFGNPFHLGNAEPGPGSDLVPQLMNGVVFVDATRYFISDLDRAILADAGLPVRPAACSPADIATTDGSAGADNAVDNGDFQLFFSSFFTADCASTCGLSPISPCNPADIAATDGSPGPDGCVDNGDFSLFFSSFFAGCQ